MENGQVKKWLPKGYGFITMGNGNEIFVHATACGDREFLNIGENVSFDLQEDDRTGKMRAANVTGDQSGEAPDLTPRNNYNNNNNRGYGNDNRGYNRNNWGGQNQGGNNGYGNNNGGYGNNNGYGNNGGNSQTKICYQFRDGHCRFGDRCRFSHEQ